MALTLDEMYGRLQLILEHIDDMNYGMAKCSTEGLMSALCAGGITINSKYTINNHGGNTHEDRT